MEKLTSEVLSNPELSKILLESDKDEKVYVGGNCKIIICSQPANLKFVLCDVEITDQESAEKRSAETESVENDPAKNGPTEIHETQEKLIVNSDLINNINNNWINNCFKEIKSLREELKKNNILLENIQAILQQKANMPGSLPCCTYCKEVIKDA